MAPMIGPKFDAVNRSLRTADHSEFSRCPTVSPATCTVCSALVCMAFFNQINGDNESVYSLLMIRSSTSGTGSCVTQFGSGDNIQCNATNRVYKYHNIFRTNILNKINLQYQK